MAAELCGWTLHEVPGPQEGSFWVELRREGVVHRIPLPRWRAQLTASPPVPVARTAYERWLLKSVRYRPSDAVVATYPKCGTTLVEQIVLLLRNGGGADMAPT